MAPALVRRREVMNLVFPEPVRDDARAQRQLLPALPHVVREPIVGHGFDRQQSGTEDGT